MGGDLLVAGLISFDSIRFDYAGAVVRCNSWIFVLFMGNWFPVGDSSTWPPLVLVLRMIDAHLMVWLG